jgi:RNA polymerase sigma-70 factor (ECF subfamily)
MQGRSDDQLMAAVMVGDHVALAALVRRHHSSLLGYLYRLVSGDRELAEDLAQETLLRLLRQHTYASHRPFKPWLYAIASNQVAAIADRVVHLALPKKSHPAENP